MPQLAASVGRSFTEIILTPHIQSPSCFSGALIVAATLLVAACVSPGVRENPSASFGPVWGGSSSGRTGSDVDINAIEKEWSRDFYRRRGYHPPIGFVYMNRNEPERIKRFNPTPPGPDEFLDPATGYIWMRCEEGQHWDGARCVGRSACFSFSAAQNHSFSRAWREEKPWRVPGMNELRDFHARVVQIEPPLSVNSSNWLWSSERPVGGEAGYVGYLVQLPGGKYTKERLGACHAVRLMRRK